MKRQSEKKKKINELIKKDRAAALGLAVMFAVSISLTGCGQKQAENEEEEQDYYYSGGHTHFYSYWGSPNTQYYGNSTWARSFGTHRAGSGYSFSRSGFGSHVGG
jgi:hypothetical protein